MRALVTVEPVLYVLEWSTASRVRPASVVVPRMTARNSSQVRSGVPARLPLMKLMLDRVPLAASGWVVAHGNLKSVSIAHHRLSPPSTVAPGSKVGGFHPIVASPTSSRSGSVAVNARRPSRNSG
jgi:hypothetical protein